MNASIEVNANDDDGLAGFVAEFRQALSVLPKEVAQVFLDRLEGLFRTAVVEFPEGSFLSADGTRRGGISVRILGLEELLAAARAAA